MGIVEASLRKNMRVGERVDVTLIGGRELRGRIVAFGEDGILLKEGEAERPIAFAGMATYLPTRLASPQRDAEEAEEQPDCEEPREKVTQAEGWIERYESGARVGSIACGGAHVLFSLGDVLDQQLCDKLEGWIGRAIPVQFTLRCQGVKRVATGITERSAQEKYAPPAAGKPAANGERYGFGEILHFDKQNGYGKAREGGVKFLFHRQDIADAALWREILASPNTCGIKIAFTVQKDGKYACIRALSALNSPETLKAPDFTELPAPRAAEGDDVNPEARTAFTDGTVMEEEIRAGMVMFYNADKSFGRLRQEDGERFYFRSSDVMQRSLLDFLCQRPLQDVEDTRVTFSVKRLPTGKLAAGRVCWEARKQPPQEAERAPAPAAQEAPASAPKPEKKEAPAALNDYCATYLRAWGGAEAQLFDQLRQAAAACADEEARREILLQAVALSDVRKEKRDDAMLGYLRACARGGGGEALGSFLSTATYAGGEMFDALTRLFAVSEGAFGRLCGIIAADGELVTLRGEILTRFGAVPETAQQLKECWRPEVLRERARTDCAHLPRTLDTLRDWDKAGAHQDWAALLEAEGPRDPEALRAVREEILRRPTRFAVEWMLPIVLEAQERDGRREQGADPVSARPLCHLARAGVRYACLEIEGEAEEVCASLEGGKAEIGPLKGCVQVALPCESGEADVVLEGRTGDSAWTRTLRMIFEAALAGPLPEDVLRAQGVAVLCGGGSAALDALEARLAQPGGEACVALRLAAAETAGAMRALLAELEAAMRAQYGADVADLLAFPAREAAQGMDAPALEEALMRVLRDFADLCLVHDRLKGARVVCLLAAQGCQEELYALALKMKECGVRTALACAEPPAAAPQEQVLRLTAEALAQALRAAGYAANDLRTASAREGEERHEIG